MKWEAFCLFQMCTTFSCQLSSLQQCLIRINSIHPSVFGKENQMCCITYCMLGKSHIYLLIASTNTFLFIYQFAWCMSWNILFRKLYSHAQTLPSFILHQLQHTLLSSYICKMQQTCAAQTSFCLAQPLKSVWRVLRFFLSVSSIGWKVGLLSQNDVQLEWWTPRWNAFDVLLFSLWIYQSTMCEREAAAKSSVAKWDEFANEMAPEAHTI